MPNRFIILSLFLYLSYLTLLLIWFCVTSVPVFCYVAIPSLIVVLCLINFIIDLIRCAPDLTSGANAEGPPLALLARN